MPHDCRVWDVTPFAAEIDLGTLDVIRWAPAWMTRAERLLLYALIFGLRPMRYLEIGTFRGGSALIVSAAMDASGHDGRMFCVDPDPQIDPAHWNRIESRATLFQGRSPEILPRCCETAGGPFDFVFIDGDHTRGGVVRDANGVLPFVEEGGYLLFHDSFFFGVAQGIESFVAENWDRVVDFGVLTREITVQTQAQAEPVQWGGLRLMQVRNRFAVGRMRADRVSQTCQVRDWAGLTEEKG